jgi:hypothetical protein
MLVMIIGQLGNMCRALSADVVFDLTIFFSYEILDNQISRAVIIITQGMLIIASYIHNKKDLRAEELICTKYHSNLIEVNKIRSKPDSWV